MNDFIAGLIGGTFGLVVGHPLDTIKALMQTRNHKTMLSSSEYLIKQTKSTGFFRGMALPFICYGPMNSLLFGIYGNSLKYLENGNKEFSMNNIFIAGSIGNSAAGIVTTIPTNPLELVKIQLQTHNRKELTGVLDCIKHIYKTEGFKGFFRGYSQLAYRDGVSYGVYFYLFEYFRRKGKFYGFDSPIFRDIVCGGLAGSFSWFLIMPFDVMKSRLQADIDHKTTQLELAKNIWQKDGLRGFFKGCIPVLIRGFIVNSVTFSCYIQTLKFLNNKEKSNNF